MYCSYGTLERLTERTRRIEIRRYKIIRAYGSIISKNNLWGMHSFKSFSNLDVQIVEQYNNTVKNNITIQQYNIMEKWLVAQLFPWLLGVFPVAQTPILTQDCQKTIKYTVETVTTKRHFELSDKPFSTPTISDPLSIEADTALLNICIANTGNCTWAIEGKRKSKLSPIGLYAVSMLRQMSGDWSASPEQFLVEKQKAGGVVSNLGNGVLSLRQTDTASGYSSVTLIDKSQCIFIGSSFYNPDNTLKFKIVYKYQTNTEGWQHLESATLSAVTFGENRHKGELTEVTTVFKSH
jgi:hypothetical protein